MGGLCIVRSWPLPALDALGVFIHARPGCSSCFGAGTFLGTRCRILGDSFWTDRRSLLATSCLGCEKGSAWAVAIGPGDVKWLWLIAVAAVVVLLSKDDEWRGYAYPNKDDLSNFDFIGSFRSLEECRAAALNFLSNLPRGVDGGDYECGLNCVYKAGVNVCEQTER